MRVRFVGMDLGARVLRENIKEPGRVSFPAVLQHWYYLLRLALSVPKQEEAMAESLRGEGETRRKVVRLKTEPARK